MDNENLSDEEMTKAQHSVQIADPTTIEFTVRHTPTQVNNVNRLS